MVHTQTDEIEVQVPVKRVWCAFVTDSHNFLPKCLPDKIASVEYEGAPGTPGCIRTLKFHKATPHGFSHVKEKLEEVNAEKLYVQFSVLEGGAAALFKHVKVAFQFKEGPNPGTTVICTKMEYESTTGEHELPEVGRQGLLGDVKAAEAYLQTHNDYA